MQRKTHVKKVKEKLYDETTNVIIGRPVTTLNMRTFFGSFYGGLLMIALGVGLGFLVTMCIMSATSCGSDSCSVMFALGIIVSGFVGILLLGYGIYNIITGFRAILDSEYSGSDYDQVIDSDAEVVEKQTWVCQGVTHSRRYDEDDEDEDDD